MSEQTTAIGNIVVPPPPTPMDIAEGLYELLRMCNRCTDKRFTEQGESFHGPWPFTMIRHALTSVLGEMGYEYMPQTPVDWAMKRGCTLRESLSEWDEMSDRERTERVIGWR